MKFLLFAKHIVCAILLFSVNFATAQKVVTRFIERDEAAEFERLDSFRMLHLMIAGNIYQNEEQIKNSYDSTRGRYSFNHELRYIQPILNLGDITIANLKTSFANDIGSPYSSPDEFALTLKYSGINTLTLANSNTGNIDKNTLQRTQQTLGTMDIVSTGAYTNNVQRNGNCPLMIYRKGFRIALLNYAILANRSEVSKEVVINVADKNLIESDLRAAKMQNVDFVIAYFDWGSNQQDIPSYTQQNLARWCFEHGVGLVVGVHPNAVLPMEFVEYYYNTQPQTGLAVYSLGNLLSSDTSLRNRNGIILDVELKKNNFTGAVTLGNYGFIPVWNYYDTITMKNRSKVSALPSAAVQDGNVFKQIPYIEQRRAANSAFEIRKALGTHSDEIQYNVTDNVVNNVDETVQLTNASLNNKLSIFKPEFMKQTDAPLLAKRQLNKEEIDTFYCIQFYAMKKLIPLDTNYYDHLKGFSVVEENGMYKYYSKGSYNLEEVMQLWLRVFKPRYKQSFIVALLNGRQVRAITLQSR
ncbi:MAG: CapA family protein [Chitinophagales bacterium]|nr:CapA family protein [Chitinophagales bacterium]